MSHTSPEGSSIFAPLNVIKSVLSTILLGFSVTLIMGLIFTEQTKVSNKVHPAVAFITIWLVAIWLTMIEGGQASIVGLAPVNRELYKKSHPWAYKCSLLCHKGDNLERYLLGRQFMVVLVVFIINNCGAAPADAELWGLPKWISTAFLHSGLAMTIGMQKFCDTGLLGALITTIVGSIAWRLAGSAFPIFFLSTPPAWVMLKVCMFFEATGMLNGAWVLGWIHKKVAGFQIDEVYIGTAEERARQNKPDNEDDLQIGAGHMIILPGFYETAPESLKALLRADPHVAEYMRSLHSMEKGEADTHGTNSDDNKDDLNLKDVMSEEFA